MTRFALAITAVELVLSIAASIVISYTESAEPYLTPDDLRTLGIPFESCKIQYRSFRLNADWSWDTRAVLLEPRASLYVSRLFNAEPVEFTRRVEKEHRLQEREPDRAVFRDDPFPDETGFVVRYRGEKRARAELVRMRGQEVLVIKVERELTPGSNGKLDVAKCEHRAAVIQSYLLDRLGWR